MRSAEQSLHVMASTVGFLSFFLIWLAVLWGIFLRNGWALTWVRHSTLLASHTTFALLGLCLAGVHAGAQLVKPTNFFQVVDLFVPFMYWRDPIGVGIGVIGLELLVAVALSIMIQRLLGYNRWRALHTLNYVAFTLVVAHILISGSDLGNPLLSGSVLGAWGSTVVVWLAATPVIANLRRRRRAPVAAPRSQDISVNVNAQRCARFGFCEHEAPEVFRLRSDGRLAYRASVPAREAAPVVRAAEVCPARAIALTRVPTTMMPPPPSPPPVVPVSPVPASPPQVGAAAGPRRRYRG